MEVRALRCFGLGPGLGNPALVIQDGPPDPHERQAFAAAQGQTCVFLDGLVADYYYPHARSVLCLHATLAAGALLFARQGHDAPLTLRTAMRGQELPMTRRDGQVHIGLQAQAVPEVPATAAHLLGSDAVIGQPCIASVGSPKLLVELRDAQALRALAPDLQAILAWGAAHGVNGIYAWCRRGNAFEGRNFNHADPAMEDQATGVAAGALSVALGRGLTLHQGGQCVLHTALEQDLVLLSGQVEWCDSSRTI